MMEDGAVGLADVDLKAAEEAGRHVVGEAFEGCAHAQERLDVVQVVEEGVAGEQAGDAEGSAGAEAAGERDAVVPGDAYVGRAADAFEGGLDALLRPGA